MNGTAGQEVENETAAQKALNEPTRQGTGDSDTKTPVLAVRDSVLSSPTSGFAEELPKQTERRSEDVGLEAPRE
jgi:hypothetical protein